MSFGPAVGVIYLQDLLSRHLWMNDKLPEILHSCGLTLDGGEVSSPFPPSHLTVICSPLYLPAIARYRAWLSLTSALSVIVDFEDDLEAWEDPEVHELVELEAQDALEGLDLLEFQMVRNVRDDALLRSRLVGGPRSASPSPLPITSQASEHAAGPWCDLSAHSFRDNDTFWPGLACVRHGKPSIYLPQRQTFLNLDDGSHLPCPGEQDDSWVAVWPDGLKFLSRKTQSSALEVHGPSASDAYETFGAFGAPVGVWPGSQIAWTGSRCVFQWLGVYDGQVSALAACEHDWPCGHEKKQYGFLDNEPCWIHLSRDGDAYLSVFQKDAIVSSAVPIRWQRCGQGWAATSASCSDPNRALFFINEGRWGANDPTDPRACDARDARPAIVLGPSSSIRYALDLNRPVYRLTNSASVLVRPPNSYYGVFDESHQLRRQGRGRLLGGWDRWLTVLDEGMLWRDDTESGDRQPLGSPEGEIDWAFSLPGTPNVVLVQDAKPVLRVRLV